MERTRQCDLQGSVLDTYKFWRSVLFSQHKGTLHKASGWNLKDHSSVQGTACLISSVLSSVLLLQQSQESADLRGNETGRI